MAEVEVGQTSFTFQRRLRPGPSRSEGTWDLGFKVDEAFGPHLILQKGTNILYIHITPEEGMKMYSFVKDIGEWLKA